MAQYTTTTTLDGFFKRIYAPTLIDAIPKFAKLYKKTKFYQNKRLGDTYNQPIVMTNEHGVTYAAAGAGAFSLNTAVAMATQNARVPSNQMLLRSQIDYESAAKAKGSDQAFRGTMETVVKNMMDSISHRLEACILYGGVGIATPASSANTNSTTTVVTISAATWAIGMWAGAEGATLNFYEDSTIIGGATYNATDSIFTISSVDVDNKAITVTGSATGIAALDAQILGSASDVRLYWYQSYGNEMNGIDSIMTNTGTLFGISASSYSLWKANSYAITGALTLAKLTDATTSAIGKGGLETDVDCYVAPQVWADVNAEMGGKQAYDYSYKSSKGDYAFDEDAIRIHTQSGIMRLHSHPMVKAGEGFILPMSTLKRIGSTDVSFSNPANNEKFFIELEGVAGFELRNYCDQAIFIEEPAKCTKLTGITY